MRTDRKKRKEKKKEKNLKKKKKKEKQNKQKNVFLCSFYFRNKKPPCVQAYTFVSFVSRLSRNAIGNCVRNTKHQEKILLIVNLRDILAVKADARLF